MHVQFPAAGWLHLRRGLRVLEALTQGRDKATMSKSLPVSCAPSHASQSRIPCRAGVEGKPQMACLCLGGYSSS